MKNIITYLLLLFIGNVTIAQELIILPEPQKEGSIPLLEALSKRKSSYQLDSLELSQQMVSNLLWAAWGYTEEDRKTAPSSQNKDEIEICLALPDGVFYHSVKDNSLIKLMDEDIRHLTLKPYSETLPPVCLIFLCNKDNMDCKNKTFIHSTAYATCGAISQNIYLFCASFNLGTSFNSNFNYKLLKNVLGLRSNRFIIGCQSIGYNKITP